MYLFILILTVLETLTTLSWAAPTPNSLELPPGIPTIPHNESSKLMTRDLEERAGPFRVQVVCPVAGCCTPFAGQVKCFTFIIDCFSFLKPLLKVAKFSSEPPFLPSLRISKETSSAQPQTSWQFRLSYPANSTSAHSCKAFSLIGFKAARLIFTRTPAATTSLPSHRLSEWTPTISLEFRDHHLLWLAAHWMLMGGMFANFKICPRLYLPFDYFESWLTLI